MGLIGLFWGLGYGPKIFLGLLIMTDDFHFVDFFLFSDFSIFHFWFILSHFGPDQIFLLVRVGFEKFFRSLGI